MEWLIRLLYWIDRRVFTSSVDCNQFENLYTLADEVTHWPWIAQVSYDAHHLVLPSLSLA